MTTAMAMPGNTANAVLVHFFGGGLADERYVVEGFRPYADGEIRPWPGEAPATDKRGRRRAERVEDILGAAFAAATSHTAIAAGQGAGRRRDRYAVHDGVAGVTVALIR